MSMLQDLQQATTQKKNAARATALQEKRNAEIESDMKAASFVSVDGILNLACVIATTAQNRTQIGTLLQPYERAGWRISIGSGAVLKDVLRGARYQIGVSGESFPYDDSSKPFADVLLRVDGILEQASLFEAHGSPEAPKCKQYDGIAVKFFEDHLGLDTAAASAISARRAIARSTVLSTANANALAAEFKKLNDQSVFHYIEEYLKTVYQWMPTTAAVNSVCYVSKARMTGWEITGTAKSAGGGVDTFSKPVKTSGHLMYAIKIDLANEKRRVLYHFEGLLEDPAVPPAGRGWSAVTADKVLGAIKSTLKAGQDTQLQSSFPAAVYYKATVD